MNNELVKFNELKSEITSVVAPVLKVSVTDATSSQGAITAALTIKEMAKRVDDLRRELVDPLNAQVKKINAYAKDISVPLDKAEAHLRSELNKFAQEQEKVRREAQRKLDEQRIQMQEELKQRQAEEAVRLATGSSIFGGVNTAEIEEKHRVETAVQRHELAAAAFDVQNLNIKNTRKTWTVNVVDITKVPKEFLIIEVNEKAALAAHKAGVNLPGLEFVETISVNIGSKTRVPSGMFG